jgi:putative nucleotidyltransferase with HDIG domain
MVRAAEHLASFPASEQAVARLRAAITGGEDAESIAVAVEASTALTLAVLRVANSRRGAAGTVATVPQALEQLGGGTLAATAQTIPSYDVLEGSDSWEFFPEHLRVHATAVRSVAERVATAVDGPPSAELRCAALLHDVGKPMMVRMCGVTVAELYGQILAPEDEVAMERERCGFDHAQAGAWLLRHWRFPDALADAVAEHHHEFASGEAGIIRVADMLVHYSQGRPIKLDVLTDAAAAIGLEPDGLRDLIYHLPDGYFAAPRTGNDCPLSDRELDVLRLLAEGKVYKQIATELDLAPSTVRSHLNRAYRRMGVADRTQAVLVAMENGWL